MYGLEPGTFDRTYRGWKKLVHPDDWPAVKSIEPSRMGRCRGRVPGDSQGWQRALAAGERPHVLRRRPPTRAHGRLHDRWTDRRRRGGAAATEARSHVRRPRDGRFFLLDAELTVIDVNRQACQSLSYRREELIGMRLRDFDAALDQTSIARFAERAEAGETVTFETLHRRKDGDVPGRDPRGHVPARRQALPFSLARDIRERKRAEEALRESDHALQRARRARARLARDDHGRATASIAHEVNQPLGAMVANGLRARAGSRPPPETLKARRASKASPRRVARERGDRTHPLAHEAPDPAQGVAADQRPDPPGHRARGIRACAATRSCCAPSLPTPCRASRATACSCSRCSSTSS